MLVPVERGPGGATRRGVVLAAALALAVTGCVGGPAADRAASVGETSSAGDSSDADGEDEGNGENNGDGDPGENDDGGSDTGPGDEPDPDETPDDPPPPDAEGTVEVEQVIDLAEVSDPSGLAVLPDGDVLVGSRDAATIHRLDADSGELTLLGEIPGVQADSGGLLGVAADEGFVYAYHAGGTSARIGRYAYLSGDDGEDPQIGGFSGVQTGLPLPGQVRGGALRFGPDGLLYATTGDGASSEEIDVRGELLRMSPDKLVDDTPDVHGSPDAPVRDVSWDSVGRLWAVDVGGALHVAAEEGFTNSRPVWEADSVPVALAHTSGSLWASDGEDAQIWRVPLNATELVAQPSALDTEGLRLTALVESEEGHLWGLSDDSLVSLSVT